MVSFKLKGKAKEQKSGFEPYDGPEPSKRGFYRAVIKKFQFGKKSSGSTGFFVVLELEAQKGDPKDHARFDGYPMFARNIITESSDGSALKEGAQRNLENLLAALNTGDDPTLILGKTGDVESGTADVEKIGGKKPVGAVVNVDINFETYEGERRPVVGGIYKFKEVEATKASTVSTDDEDEDDETDLLDDNEEASEVDERAAELEEMKIADLRSLAKELGIKSSGTKDVVIEAILDAEFPEDDEDADENEDEEDEDETEEDESEDDDEEEDEESDDDERAEREEELAGFDRKALKAVLKSIAPEFKIFTRHSDDDLREAILDNEFGEETPF